MTKMNSPSDSEWWRAGVLYQIYPRSFRDSDGDGIGDLLGIVERLDHLVGLGIDGLWISPIYDSPMVDFGYDITDHCAIHPMFGTLDDFDRLVEAVHAHGMKLILDFVPCHTSDRHPWFLDSRRSRDAEKRDWYLWRDPAPDGGPPNNWLSEFGGSAWTWDEATGQYYCHAHLGAQPDLNWRNPAVVAAQLDVMRFWFERGIDGFRVDAVDQLVKDATFTDNPPNPDWHEGKPSTDRLLRIRQKDRDETLERVADMRRVADGHDGMLIGEVYLPIERMVRYYGAALDGFQMPHNFWLISTEWAAAAVRDVVECYERALPERAWPNWVASNHDRHRVASRVGAAQARIAAMLLLTLRGTPTIYQGDELGMENAPIPADRVQDPWERNMPGLGLGRDPVRTPLAWDASPGAGFTTGEPWLPIDTRAERHVAHQLDDPDSMLALYRRLIDLRRREPALAVGEYETLYAENGVYAFVRRHLGRRLIVALNFTDEPRPLHFAGRTLLSSLPSADAGTGSGSGAMLAANEGRLLEG